MRGTAMAITMATAGRTVVFSGVTVAIAVTGLMFIDMTIIRSVGAGAVSVVVIAVVVATTLVPALLVLHDPAHRRAGQPREAARSAAVPRPVDHTPSDDGWFGRWAAQVQRRPWPAFSRHRVAADPAVGPAWRINLVSSGVGLLPPDNPHRYAFEQVQAQFPYMASPEVTVVADAADAGALATQAATIDELAGGRSGG